MARRRRSQAQQPRARFDPPAETGASGVKNSGGVTLGSATCVTDNGPLDLPGNMTPNGTGVLVYFRGANGYLHMQGTPTLNLSAPTAAKSGSCTRSRQRQHVDHWGSGANATAASRDCPPGSAPTPTLL